MAKLSEIFLNLLGKAVQGTGDVIQGVTSMTPQGRSMRQATDFKQQELDNQRLTALAHLGSQYDINPEVPTGKPTDLNSLVDVMPERQPGIPANIPGMGPSYLTDKPVYDVIIKRDRAGNITGYENVPRPKGGRTIDNRPPSGSQGRPTLKEVPGTGRMEWFYPPGADAGGSNPSIGAGSGIPVAQGLTKAQGVVDTKFADDYNDFVAQGGQSDPVKLVSGIEDAITKLGKTNKATGRVMGLVGRHGRAFINPNAGLIEDEVRDAVQRNLRIILGGQFAEREGENLVRTAYNPTLPESVVAKRLSALSTQMKLALKSKQDAVNYYEKNGTLAGFKGKLYSMADFQKVVGGDTNEGPLLGSVKTVNSKQEYDALPSGTQYYDSSGTLAIKQ